MSKTIMQKLVFSFLLLFLFFTVALAEYKVDKKNSSVGFIACMLLSPMSMGFLKIFSLLQK